MGVYRFAFLAGLLIATIITIGVNLSPAASSYAGFVKDAIWIVWAMVGLEWFIHHSTGISIFPFGSRDEDTYLLQKLLGYDGAIVVAVIGGIFLAAFFGLTAMDWGITWMPVSNMLTPGLNVMSNWAVTFFSGGEPAMKAFIDGLIPTFFENPLLIYSTVFLIWIIPRYILNKVFRVPDTAANIIGLITWLALSGVIFSFAYHSFAYEAVEPAYTRAYIFVVSNGVLVGLTGIPFPMDISHFVNNYVGSYFGIISWGMVMMIPLIITRIGKNKKFNFRLPQIRMPRLSLPSIMPSVKGIASIFIICILVITAIGGYTVYRLIQNEPIIPQQIADYIPLSLTGWTTLSLSEVDFSTDNPNDPFWNEQVWILTVAQGGMAQSATGTFTANEIEQESGVRPEKILGIDITYSEQSCEYAIKTNQYTTPIYKYEYYGFTKPLCLDVMQCIKDYCNKHHPNWVWGGAFQWSAEAFCVEEIMYTGAIAYNTIENPYVHTISKIRISNGVESLEGTIDTKGNIAQQIGNNIYVTWNGYLGKDTCETQNPYYAFYRDGSWKLGWASNYESYRTTYDTFILSMDNAAQNGWTVGKASLLNFITLANNAANSALQQTSFGQIDKVTSLSDAMIVQDLSDYVSIPTYTFYVKASYLGVYQPIAESEILETTSQSFKAGSEGQIYVKFKNVGDGRGTFSVWAECSPPFQQVGSTQSYTLEAGEIGISNIRITADTDQPIEATCTVHAKVLNSDATKSVAVKVDPNQVCDPNKYYCVDNFVKKCNDHGSVLVTIEDCSPGRACIYLPSGQTTCEETGQCTSDRDCDDGDYCTTDKCEETLTGKKCIHTPIPNCEVSDENKCYMKCDADSWLDPTKVSAIPCKIECWFNYHIIHLVVGAIAAFIVFLGISKLNEDLVVINIVIAIVIFLLTVFVNIGIGIIALIIAGLILLVS